MLIHLIYISRAVRGIRGTDVDAILNDSRARNARTSVTGMLLFADDSFIQVLEGEEAAVADIFASIERDPRHRGVTVLVREHIKERHFAEWSMGFERMSGALPASFTDVFLINSDTLRERLRAATQEIKNFMYGFVEIAAR